MAATNYRVRSGDTLSGLAKVHSTTVNALVKANGITNPNRLLAGQQLVIPGKTAPQPAQRSPELRKSGTSDGFDAAPAQRPASTPPVAKMASSALSKGSALTVDLNDFLSAKKGTQSLAAIVIGNAEGTRTPSGGVTPSFGQHADPGNAKVNKGSFSYQDGKVGTAAEADQRQLQTMRKVKADYVKKATAAGLDPNNALLASAFFDSYNQSKTAGMRFLKQLPSLKEQGITPQTVIEARVRSWIDPSTGSRYLNSKGEPVGGGLAKIAQKRAQKEGRVFQGEMDVQRTIRADQFRRVNAMVKALTEHGLMAPPSPQAAQPTRGTPSPTPAAPTPAPHRPVGGKGLPDTSRMTESQKFDTYSAYFQEKGVQMDTDSGERTILGLRVPTNQNSNEGKGVYDDRIVVLWKDADGQKHVREFTANTEPSAAYLKRGYGEDVDGKNGRELGQIADGYYVFDKGRGNTRSLKNQPVLRPFGKVAADYDANQDGFINDRDRVASRGRNRLQLEDMLFHAGGNTKTGSAGCQTMKPADFSEFLSALGGDHRVNYLLVTVH